MQSRGERFILDDTFNLNYPTMTTSANVLRFAIRMFDDITHHLKWSASRRSHIFEFQSVSYREFNSGMEFEQEFTQF